MPIEIVILLLIAVAGIAGCVVLMVCNASLSRRGIYALGGDGTDALDEDALTAQPQTAQPQNDEPQNDEPPTVQQPAPQAAEIKFTPLGQEEPESAQPQPGEPETGEPESAQPRTARAAAEPLRLVPRHEEQTACARVGGIALGIGNAQDIGARLQQQDAFAITPLEESLVVRDHGVMAVVCDGMGGMENGAEAANTGAIQFMRAYLAADRVDDNTLVDAAFEANDAVYRAFGARDGVRAGTTLAAVSVLPDGLRFVSVGDSHIYLFRKNKLHLINRDHNYFSELMEEVKAGRMTLEEAQRHPERAHLTSFVGLEKLELIDYNVKPVPLRPGDRVLVCSDGLFKTLSVQEMTAILSASRGREAQDDLLRAVRAKARRRQDNVTLVVLYCDAV